METTIMGYIGLCWVYNGIMEKKMGANIMGWGLGFGAAG